MPLFSGMKLINSLMIINTCARPFFGGMNFSTRSLKKMQPTLSLFCAAEKASTAAISVIVFFLSFSVVPNMREPLTSINSIIVSSRSSS